ncbi:MAG: hypothetical protein AAFX08_12710 [Pseudomonadota bacterium]
MRVSSFSFVFPRLAASRRARRLVAVSAIALASSGCASVFGFAERRTTEPTTAPQIVDAEAAGVTLRRASYTPHTGAAAPQRATGRPAGLIQCATGVSIDTPCRRRADRHTAAATTPLEAAETFSDK